jgi:YegS/Rv2252/BmrU family lipid kinase
MPRCALLRPDIPERAVEPFRKVSPDLKAIADLTGAADVSAALIFGGDGTVHRHLSQLSLRKIPALIVPVGSGNDFAKALGIRNNGIALAAWQRFCATGKNVRTIDLGRIHSVGQEILFCCVAGMGLDADSNARANRMRPWLRSHGGYVIAAIQSIAAGRRAKIHMRSPLVENRSRSWLLAVGNAHRYGGGARIVPQANVDDGLLDVCFVRDMSKFKLLCVLPTVFWGGHLRLKEVSYYRVAVLEVDSDPELQIYADGEPVCETPAKFSVLPQALKVIVPL